MGNALRIADCANAGRNTICVSGAGGNECKGCIRRAGQHGDHHVLHSVFVFVRGDVLVAEREGWAGSDSRAWGTGNGAIGIVPWICDHVADDCGIADSLAGRAEQNIGGSEDRWVDWGAAGGGMAAVLVGKPTEECVGSLGTAKLQMKISSLNSYVAEMYYQVLKEDIINT